MDEDNESYRTELTAHIVSAYVENNHVKVSDISELINIVRESLESLDDTELREVKKDPAVPIKSSVKHDCIICLEDGLRFRSLKRHLKAVHDMTPDEYRLKWNLPSTYPMVAPNYSDMRSQLAKSFNFGRLRPASQRSRKKTG